MARTTAPRGLDARGKALWRDVTGSYALRVDELRVLEAACRTADELERLQGALAEQDVTVPGSRGNPRPNPLIEQLREHRSLLARLVKQLALPDVPAGVEGVQTPSQLSAKRSAAARARWDRVAAERAAALNEGEL